MLAREYIAHVAAIILRAPLYSYCLCMRYSTKIILIFVRMPFPCARGPCKDAFTRVGIASANRKFKYVIIITASYK